MKKSTLLLLSIISISLSLISSSNLFAEENPIPVLTQKAPDAAKYFKKLKEEASDKGYEVILDENQHIEKDSVEKLEENWAFCFDFYNKKDRKNPYPSIFRTYLIETIGRELRSEIKPSFNALNQFSGMFRSNVFSSKSILCDKSLTNGRQIIFISGKKHYSLSISLQER